MNKDNGSEQLFYSINSEEYSTVKCGGILSKVAMPSSMQQLKVIGRLIAEEGLKYIITGRMSNILVSDDGYDGLIINTSRLKGYEKHGKELFAGGGESLSKISYLARKAGLGGLERSGGIPGSIGGAVCMNSGCYGWEMSQSVKKAYIYNLEKQESIEKAGDELDFSYRHSNIMTGKEVVVGVCMEMEEKNPFDLESIYKKIKISRQLSQPQLPSLGSVFKRVQGSSAGIFIEGAKLKGYSVNGMQFSTVHANFIVNRGGGKAKDYITLMELAEKKVFESYGIKLEREVKLISGEAEYSRNSKK